MRVPRVKLGIESEPVGPGSSVSTLSDPEALALLAVANLIGGFAHVFHSGNGVRWWLGAVEDEPGVCGCAQHAALPTPRPTQRL